MHMEKPPFLPWGNFMFSCLLPYISVLKFMQGNWAFRQTPTKAKVKWRGKFCTFRLHYGVSATQQHMNRIWWMSQVLRFNGLKKYLPQEKAQPWNPVCCPQMSFSCPKILSKASYLLEAFKDLNLIMISSFHPFPHSVNWVHLHTWKMRLFRQSHF